MIKLYEKTSNMIHVNCIYHHPPQPQYFLCLLLCTLNPIRHVLNFFCHQTWIQSKISTHNNVLWQKIEWFLTKLCTNTFTWFTLIYPPTITCGKRESLGGYARRVNLMGSCLRPSAGTWILAHSMRQLESAYLNNMLTNRDLSLRLALRPHLCYALM